MYIGVLWIDFDAFHADKRNQEFNGLKEAMDTIGNENPLTDEEENVIARFAYNLHIIQELAESKIVQCVGLLFFDIPQRRH